MAPIRVSELDLLFQMIFSHQLPSMLQCQLIDVSGNEAPAVFPGSQEAIDAAGAWVSPPKCSVFDGPKLPKVPDKLPLVPLL